MANCNIKIFNPNPYDVSIKTGNSPTKAPDGYSSVRAGKTESFNYPQGKWIFFDKITKNRTSPVLGQVQFDNQMFVVPQVPD
jgi:hypothetical protein